MATDVWITGNIKLLYILLMLSKWDFHPHVNLLACIFQPQTVFQQHFSDIDASAKKVSVFQNPLNCAPEELLPNLQLEAINCNVFCNCNFSNDILKGKYQKNLIDFYDCLPSNEYAQLKSYAYGLILVFGSTYLSEKTFSKLNT